jgi:mRNA interferase RelE/StbE
MNIEYSEEAIKNLKSFDNPDIRIIVEKIEYLANNFDVLKNSKKITELKGIHKNKYRFIIARKIRAIFQIRDDKITLLIIKIGKRKDVYE